jgi:adenine-specific DNA-methyltransferase
MKFLTGVLNSQLISYWLRHKGKMQGALYQVDKGPLLSIPLPPPESCDQKPIIALVAEILAAKKVDPNADTSALESQIDEKVFDLYGLEKPERDIIRQSVN